ncbi:MAG TPA: class I SAM-dependent methyltransferase [Pyrinomonadaceae bacterium]|nr:class I SAM-dependent methyltransferase [Pyrinomonadaceae bacterium]
MPTRRCPACGSESRDARGEKNGLRVSACRDCGTLYAHHREAVAGADAEAYDYDAYYHEANLSVPAFISRRLDEIFQSFAPHRKSNRLLDVGCGAGSLLEAARRAGWDAEGTEVSRPAVEHVRAEGFEVFHGELAEANYPEAHFDVVTASEIIEHVPEPLPMLREIARILRPGGLFWATTPHGRGLSARVLGIRWSTVSPPEHLQLFTLGGVRGLLREAGFRSAHITSHGCNPYELRQAFRRGAESDEQNGAGIKEQLKAQSEASTERVTTSYQLNEALMKNPATRFLKAALNGALGAARLGDSIKIRAVK